MQRLLSLCAILWLAQPSSLGQTAERLTWMMADTPPFHIADGPFKEQGIRDQQTAFLQSRLPQFDHRIVVASLARIWYEMRHADGICIIGVVHAPEREAFALFTRRAESALGNAQMILKKKTVSRIAPALDASSAIDLDQLASIPALVGGYEASRRYAMPVLDFIRRDDRIVRMEKVLSVPELINLLDADRVDFILAKAIEAAYYAERAQTIDRYVALPIRGPGPPEQTYTACSNGPIGRAAVTAIDLVLQDEEPWAAFSAPASRWARSHPLVRLASIQPSGKLGQP